VTEILRLLCVIKDPAAVGDMIHAPSAVAKQTPLRSRTGILELLQGQPLGTVAPRAGSRAAATCRVRAELEELYPSVSEFCFVMSLKVC
jgi:hypothetical protein